MLFGYYMKVKSYISMVPPIPNMSLFSKVRSVNMWLSIYRTISVHVQAVSGAHYIELNYQQAVDVWN